jgi:hypothetical protein
MSAVWRCRLCEGVNQGGRVCATCGAEVPHGEPLRKAVRTRIPPATRRESSPAPPPVPPTPRRRDYRDLPTPDELRRAETPDLFAGFEDLDIRPMPGGCLVTMAPRSRSHGGWG